MSFGLASNIERSSHDVAAETHVGQDILDFAFIARVIQPPGLSLQIAVLLLLVHVGILQDMDSAIPLVWGGFRTRMCLCGHRLKPPANLLLLVAHSSLLGLENRHVPSLWNSR